MAGENRVTDLCMLRGQLFEHRVGLAVDVYPKAPSLFKRVVGLTLVEVWPCLCPADCHFVQEVVVFRAASSRLHLPCSEIEIVRRLC